MLSPVFNAAALGLTAGTVVYYDGSALASATAVAYGGTTLTVSGTLSCPATTGTSNPGERFGAGAAPGVTAGTVGNTVIGQTAGAAITGGSHNTILGFQAAGGLTTGGSNIVIGSQVTVPAGQSNSIVLTRNADLTNIGTRSIVLGLGTAPTGAGADSIYLGANCHGSRANTCFLGPNQHAIAFLEDSSTAVRDLAEIRREWATSTDASRAGRLQLGAYSTSTFQEGVRVEANSGGVRLGFFGGAAAAKPTVTGSRGGNAALASLLTALASLGLITDGTTD